MDPKSPYGRIPGRAHAHPPHTGACFYLASFRGTPGSLASVLQAPVILSLILYQPGLGVPMVFDAQPPSPVPIILDFRGTERLRTITGLPHLVQNFKRHLQFTGREIVSGVGLPKN